VRRAACLLCLFGCAAKDRPVTALPFDTAAWRAEVQGYFATRDEWLPGAYGPLAQTGLCRLELSELPATLGNDSSSACIVPGTNSPARIGRLARHGDTLTLAAEAKVFWVGAKALRDGEVLALRDAPVLDGATAWHGPLRITARWDGAMITVWIADTLTPARESFGTITRWPLDPAWRLNANLEPARDEWREVETVRGFELPRQVAGRLTVTVNGATHRLTAYGKGRGARSMLVVIRDGTTGVSSYRAGRFVDVPLPDSAGHTVVDLNLARNPDCAFTTASPCPLPPRENWFAERIEAGEQTYLSP
jgi:hypothetical protein